MTQFGFRPQMSEARKRIDAAGYAFQAKKAANAPVPEAARPVLTPPKAPRKPPTYDTRELWSEDQLKTLENMWSNGYSATEIGETLGRSRNSVLGKIHREGFSRNGPSLASILASCASAFNLSPKDLKKYGKHYPVNVARNIFYYFAKEKTNKNCREIGEFIGRDRTTVIYGHASIGKMLQDGRISPETLATVM